METDDPNLPYTVFTIVPGKPQLRKMAPIVQPPEEKVAKEPQFPLAGVTTQYPLG